MNAITQARPNATGSVVDCATFNIGLRLAACLLDAAKEHKEDGQLSATFRGRGVGQNVFARAFIERAQEDPAVFTGFVSGLSGVLAAWAAGEQVTAEDIRQTRWEDVHGGPDTTYWGEVIPSTQPKEPPSASGGSATTPEIPAVADEAIRNYLRRAIEQLSEVQGSEKDAAAVLYWQADVSLGSLLQWIDPLPLTDKTAHAITDWVDDIEALLHGAVALQPTDDRAPRGNQALACLAMIRLLLEDPMPAESDEAFEARNIRAGLALFADMGDAILKHPEAAYLESDTRALGVRLNVNPADGAIETLRYNVHLQHGFSAALTGTIRATMEDITPYAMDEIRTMDPALLGPGTFVIPTDDTPPTSPSTSQQEPAPSAVTETNWRLTVADLMDQVQGLMGAAAQMDLDTGNGPFARQLVYDAQKVIDRFSYILREGKADDYYGDCIIRVQAMLIGATSMTETNARFPRTLAVAVDMLEQVSKILDDAGLTDTSDGLPPALRPSDEEVAAFMEGKALCADMVAEAIRIEEAGSDEASLECRYRGRDLPQNNFAMTYLSKVMERPELLVGFAAALSNTLNCAGTGNDDPDNMRNLSYVDYLGGPGANWDLGDGSQVGDTDTATDAPDAADLAEFVPANRSEEGFHIILQRLDLYMDSLQHVQLGDKGNGALPKVVTAWWNARTALDQHAKSGAIMQRLRMLRNELQEMAEAMGEDIQGFPIVQGCLRPLNILFRRESGGVELTPERIQTAHSAGAFIERMVGVFRDGHRHMESGDWDAIHAAASVVMSALDDPLEDDAALKHRLGVGIDSASVVFENRMPEEWKSSGIRPQDVGKRFIGVAH